MIHLLCNFIKEWKHILKGNKILALFLILICWFWIKQQLQKNLTNFAVFCRHWRKFIWWFFFILCYLRHIRLFKKINISHTFPNIEIIFRILLTANASNNSSEGSLSVLKRLKNHIKNSRSKRKLQAFSIYFNWKWYHTTIRFWWHYY